MSEVASCHGYPTDKEDTMEYLRQLTSDIITMSLFSDDDTEYEFSYCDDVYWIDGDDIRETYTTIEEAAEFFKGIHLTRVEMRNTNEDLIVLLGDE